MSKRSNHTTWQWSRAFFTAPTGWAVPVTPCPHLYSISIYLLLLFIYLSIYLLLLILFITIIKSMFFVVGQKNWSKCQTMAKKFPAHFFFILSLPLVCSLSFTTIHTRVCLLCHTCQLKQHSVQFFFLISSKKFKKLLQVLYGITQLRIPFASNKKLLQ